MLADDDAAAGHQSLGGLGLSLQVEPGVGVLDVHVRGGDDGLDAQEEAGVAGDDFRVGIRADVADVGIGDLAGVHEFLELHTGDDAGDVTGLKGHVERVVEVGEAGLERAVAGHGNDLDLGVLRGGELRELLMAVGVGDDEVAALLDGLNALVVALFVLGDVVEPHHVAVAEARCRHGLADALDVGVGVAFVLVADEDGADLQAGGRGSRVSAAGRGAGSGGRRGAAAAAAGVAGGAVAAAAGDQRESHDEREEQCKVLLHSLLSFSHDPIVF